MNESKTKEQIKKIVGPPGWVDPPNSPMVDELLSLLKSAVREEVLGLRQAFHDREDEMMKEAGLKKHPPDTYIWDDIFNDRIKALEEE